MKWYSRWSLVVVLVGSLAMMSCHNGGGGNNADQPVGDKLSCLTGELKDFGIIGGKSVDASAWVAKSTVALLQFGDSKDETSLCTGTLIDTNIVLTAAHCVDKAAKNPTEKLKVIFATNLSCEAKQKVLTQSIVAASEVIIHPAWKSKGADLQSSQRGDIALVRLSTVAPSPYVAMPLSESFIAPESTGRVLVAGYGNTVDYSAQMDTIRLNAVVLQPLKPSTLAETQSAFRDFLKKEKKSDGTRSLTDEQVEKFVGSYFAMGPDKEMLFVDQSEGKGVCSGDSGGPSFMVRSGQTYVTGVASYVLNLTGSRKCHKVGAHTSTYFHKSWIEKNFTYLKTGASRKTTPFQ